MLVRSTFRILLLLTLLAASLVPAGADPVWIFGMHDPGGEQNAVDMGKRAWITFTEGIGSNPNDYSGRDYTQWSNAGHGVIVRLNNGYGSAGTLPYQSQYQNFATRCANYVAASRGCHIWIIGNEVNGAGEWPGNVNGDPTTGEPITVARYIDCYIKARAAIKAKAGHENDQVCPAAIGTYGPPYPAQGIDPFDDYFVNQLNGLAGQVDAIILHAYTHGSDPSLIASEALMGYPYNDIHFNFRVYRDYMNRIPASMRSLPVYITESDQDVAWADQNSGWVKNAYSEINNWNNTTGNQKIRALCLYRWPNADKWGIESKQGVINDWRDAMTNNYRWDNTPTIKITSGPSVTGSTTTTVTISWTTDVASTSRIDYGTTSAYGTYRYDGTLARNHSFTLLGLTPNVPYHYKVTSTAAGYADAASGDLIAISDPISVFTNGTFETGSLSPWTAYGMFDGIQSGAWFNGVTPHGGTYMVGSAANGGNKISGIYQRCKATPGSYYRLNGWGYTWQNGGTAADNQVMFGFDPAGGVDPYSTSVQWTTPLSPQGAWAKSTSILLPVEGNALTVFGDIDQKVPLNWNVSCLDDISLTEIPSLPIPAAKALGDGTEVALRNRVVTLGYGSISGVFYIEEPDRQSGIRVVWNGNINAGSVLDVVGTMGQSSSGERQIVASTVKTISTGTVPKPVGIRLSLLGGSDFNGYTKGAVGVNGLNNVGLLIRTYGRVAKVNNTVSFTIDDGYGTPITVTSPSALSLNAGDYVSVTGVVFLGGSSSSRYPVIRLRAASDLTKY